MTGGLTDARPSIAVLHPNLSRGGSGAVCLNILKALDDDYDVTLVTDAEPDFDALNEFFGTNVGNVDIRTADIAGAVVKGVKWAVSPFTTVGFDRLRKALLTRYLDGIASEFDLVVSTKNELSHPAARVQYLHTPKWDREGVPGLLGSDNPVQPLYDAVCDWLAGFDPETVAAATLLTNSEWTADLVNDVYGVRPQVIYPPVDTIGFEPRPWGEREPGFITVGRLSPNKNIGQAIEIVSDLHDRHPEVHLHLVGPVSHPEYGKPLLDDIAEREYVHYEGPLPRSELLDLVSTHRYGLHTRPHESFGIAVAEFVAGGALPFVPATGAVTEIVNNREELQFESTAEAVKKIDQYVRDPGAGVEVRRELPNVEERFGRDRFELAIREVIQNEVSV